MEAEFIEKFTHTFVELGEDLVRLFPQDGEFRIYVGALKAAVAFTPHLVHSEFHQKVTVPFGDRILQRDESFFLAHDYREEKAGLEGAAEFIEKLKDLWATMDATSRDTVWKYFRVLVYLSRKVVGT